MTISVEEQNIICENLTTDLGFCKKVEECFHKKYFGQKILFHYTYGKWLMSFFFYLERKVGEETVRQLVDCVEDSFTYKMSELKKLGWCTNYQVQTEKVVMNKFYSRIRVSFPN